MIIGISISFFKLIWGLDKLHALHLDHFFTVVIDTQGVSPPLLSNSIGKNVLEGTPFKSPGNLP
jgi:hypothetical protein